MVFVCHTDKKYFPNIRKGICPICGKYLVPGDEGSYECDNTSDSDTAVSFDSSDDYLEREPDISHEYSQNENIVNKNGNRIEGIVSSVVKNEVRRNIFSELFYFIGYGQHFGDSYYQLTINERSTNIKYTAVVYGDFSGGGVVPTEGCEVSVRGKFSSRGIFYIRDMTCNGAYANVVDSGKVNQNINSGSRNVMGFSRGTAVIIAIIGIIIAICCVLFIPEVQAFLMSWLSVMVALIILGVFVRGLRGLSSNIYVLLIISFIITLMLYNFGGLGTLFASTFGNLIEPIAIFLIIILGIFLMIKSIL